MKRITIIAISILALASCTNYLDIKPYGRTIPKTADEYASLLNSTLNDIDKDNSTLICDMQTIMFYEAYTDNLETSLSDFSIGVDLPLYIGDNLSSMQTTYWSIYQIIRDCNIVIGGLEERNTQLGTDVLGTAYALRGVCYYELIRQFCQPFHPTDNNQLGVPIVTEFDMEAKPLRSTLEQTVDRALEDLQNALEYDIQDKVYRFNNDVIRGYLARLCFWSQRYDLAITYADQVLKNHPLINGDAYKEMMTTQIQRKGNTLIKAGIISEAQDDEYLAGYKTFLKSRPLSSRFLSLFPEKERDIRYDLLLGPRRTNKKNLYSSMRTDEMCLILAESHYHQGESGEALNYLNLLRRNRIKNVVDFTAATLPAVDTKERITVDAKGNALTPLINAILNERRKEFYLENGDRWFELKRNGCPEFWVSRGGVKFITEKFMYTFPIYVRDVVLIEGMIQNPGYENIK